MQCLILFDQEECKGERLNFIMRARTFFEIKTSMSLGRIVVIKMIGNGLSLVNETWEDQTL